jgi:photosynthetic reaction center cytochrome c subunit
MNIRFNRPSKKLIVSTAVAWLGTAVPFGITVHAQTPPPQNIKSGTYFKNVTVLKDIPVDEFMGTMGLFSAALSYCCGDCHIGAGGSNPDWASDKNPRKVIARQMAKMVSTINHDNFAGAQKVTCWTCHRGNPGPAITPPIDSIYGEPPSNPSDVITQARPGSGALTLDQIVDKYTSALGSQNSLNALTSYSSKGTSHLFGETREDQFESYAKAPDQIVTIVHQREGDLARSFNGTSAWVMLPLTVVQEYQLNQSAREGAKLDAELAFPWKIKSFFQTWRVGFPGTLDGKPVNIIQGQAPGILATFYFDSQSGLLTRVIHYADSAVGRVPTQIDYSDYRPVAGVQMPFQWTYSWVSGREEYKQTDLQPNVQIDAAKFGRPVQRAK